MPKYRKVEIPAKIYDATLSLINRIRVKQGWKPLKKIPKGYSCDSSLCPIGHAILPRKIRDNERGDVGPCYFGYWNYGTSKTLLLAKTPKYAKEFIKLVDSGEEYDLVLPVRKEKTK